MAIFNEETENAVITLDELHEIVATSCFSVVDDAETARHLDEDGDTYYRLPKTISLEPAAHPKVGATLVQRINFLMESAADLHEAFHDAYGVQ